MSSHRLFNLMHCREHETGDKPAYRFGRWAHTYILEGEEEFWRGHVIGGVWNRHTGSHYGFDSQRHVAFDERIPAVDVIPVPSFNRLQAMRHSVFKIPGVSSRLGSGRAEQVARTSYRGVACQIRADWLVEGANECLDFKTCRNIEDFNFAAINYGYLNQAAFYREVLRIVTGQDWCMYLLPCEKNDMPRSKLIRLRTEKLDKAQEENERALDSIPSDSVYRRQW